MKCEWSTVRLSPGASSTILMARNGVQVTLETWGSMRVFKPRRWPWATAQRISSAARSKSSSAVWPGQ